VLGSVLHLRGWMLASLALAAAPLVVAAVLSLLLFDQFGAARGAALTMACPRVALPAA
jgi:hypothetical protein